MRKGKWVLVSLILCAFVAPEVGLCRSESGPSTPTTASRPAETPDDAAVSDSLSDRVRVLCEDHWVDVVAAIFWVLVTVAQWSVGLGVLGLILGIVIYFRLRKRGLFDITPGVRGRFGWLWGFLFALATAFGGAYGGGWLGLERGIKNEMLSRGVVDKFVVRVIQANVLHAADLDLTGKETPEQLQEIVAQSDAVAQLVMEDFVSLLDEVIDAQAEEYEIPTWLVDVVRKKVRQKFLDKMKDELGGVDPRLLAIVLFDVDRDKYLEKYPQAKPAAALLTGFLNSIRQDAVDRVKGFTRSGVYTGLIGCTLLPFLILWIFRMAMRRRSPA